MLQLVGKQSELDQVTFTWNPPYTINGVPILGYELNISIISASDENVIHKVHDYINNTELTVVKPKSNNTCIYINISVLASNPVGKGEAVNDIFYYSESKGYTDKVNVLQGISTKPLLYLRMCVHVCVHECVYIFAHLFLKMSCCKPFQSIMLTTYRLTKV